MALVKATKPGWDGLQRRKTGEVFQWPEDRPFGSWVEPADPKDQKTKDAIAQQAERAEHARLLREQFGGSAKAAEIAAETKKALADLNAVVKETAGLKAQLSELGDLTARITQAKADLAELEQQAAATKKK